MTLKEKRVSSAQKADEVVVKKTIKKYKIDLDNVFVDRNGEVKQLTFNPTTWFNKLFKIQTKKDQTFAYMITMLIESNGFYYKFVGSDEEENLRALYECAVDTINGDECFTSTIISEKLFGQIQFGFQSMLPIDSYNWFVDLAEVVEEEVKEEK